MTPEDAIALAQKKTLPPVLLLVGAEHVLRQRVEKAIVTALVEPTLADFNYDRFVAGESKIESVVNACRTVPMMSEKRLVRVTSLDRWETGDGESDAKKQAPLDVLAEYAANPDTSTVLMCVAEKIDARRRFAALAKKQNFVVACEPLDDRSLVQRITRRFKELGHAASSDVCTAIAMMVGPELGGVEDAIERLSLYVGPKEPVTDEAVQTCVTRVRLADTWALCDALRQKNLPRALEIFRDAYDPRDRGLPMLGAIAWSTRQTLRYVLAVRSGASDQEAAKRAGVFQFTRQKELASVAKTADAGALQASLSLLAETDLALKGDKRPADLTLETMIVSMCS